LQLQDWARRQGRRIEVVPVRGNVDTRLALVRSGTVDAVVLAAAGLRRLGYLSGEGHGRGTHVQGILAEVLELETMLPAPGQGALALEVARTLDPGLAEHVRGLDDAAAHTEALVERGFLARLEAGCTAPVGARAVVKSVRGTSHDLTLTAVIGRTLLSNLAAPADSGPPLRLDVAGTSESPADFGALHADGVLAKLQSFPPPALD
jgi:hydroxymethylbilane synthase